MGNKNSKKNDGYDESENENNDGFDENNNENANIKENSVSSAFYSHPSFWVSLLLAIIFISIIAAALYKKTDKNDDSNLHNLGKNVGTVVLSILLAIYLLLVPSVFLLNKYKLSEVSWILIIIVMIGTIGAILSQYTCEGVKENMVIVVSTVNMLNDSLNTVLKLFNNLNYVLSSTGTAPSSIPSNVAQLSSNCLTTTQTNSLSTSLTSINTSLGNISTNIALLKNTSSSPSTPNYSNVCNKSPNTVLTTINTSLNNIQIQLNNISTILTSTAACNSSDDSTTDAATLKFAYTTFGSFQTLITAMIKTNNVALKASTECKTKKSTSSS
jgi:hypothetical protein